MIVFNKKNSLYVETISGVTVGNYSVYSYDSFGCKSSEPVKTGELTFTTGAFPVTSFEVDLLDGEYEIHIIADNFPDEVEKVSVFYNFLPEILLELKELLCWKNCTDCGEVDLEKEFLKLFMAITSFSSSTGIVNSLPATKSELSKLQELLSQECIYKRYYGKFNFPYKSNLKRFFLYFYTELYLYQSTKVKSLNEDSLIIDELFMVSKFDQCIGHSDLTIKEVSRNISNLKCNCDELL